MQFAATTWMEWIDSGRWLEVRGAELPVSPILVDHALRLAHDPDVSVHRIVRLVSKEQVLASRVLRLANSASNAPVRPITTITDATVRVGTNAVRSALLAACVTPALKAQAMHTRGGDRLLEHAIGTAVMAELIAAHVDADAGEALVCGLLHDIGKLAILKLSVDAPGYRGHAPTQEEVDQVVAERHAFFGGQLLRAWRLPDRLREPVLYHHRPDLSVLFTELTVIVYVANRLSHRYGFGCEAEPDEDLLADAWAAELDLDEAWLAEMDRIAPDRFLAAQALAG